MPPLFGKKLTDEDIEAALKEIHASGVEFMEHLATLDSDVHLPASEKKSELLAYVKEAEKLWEPIATKLIAVRKTIKPY
jgi:hypothetical protein